MNYLVLEDDPERIRIFRQHYDVPGNLVVVCRTVTEAIQALRTVSFEVVSLDHDLDGRVYVPSEEPNTGYQLAKIIAASGLEFNQVLVHSFNQKGALKMLEVLRCGGYHQAQWVPFSLIEKENI